jgi:hypothetical protein
MESIGYPYKGSQGTNKPKMTYSNTNLNNPLYSRGHQIKSSNSIKDNLSANYGKVSGDVRYTTRENKSNVILDNNSYKSNKSNGEKAKSISQKKYYVNSKTNYLGKKTYEKPTSVTNYLNQNKTYSPKRNRSNQKSSKRYPHKRI